MLRRLATKPLRPVETVFSYRTDADNPILTILGRDVCEALKKR